MRYFAGRNINAGEELFIYYGDNLWFKEEEEGKGGEEESSSDEDEDGDFLSRMKI